MTRKSASGPSSLGRLARPIGLMLCLLATSQALAAPQTCPPRPLNILLTNDDGYDTPGIVALHEALQEAGHRVKRIAPAENQSGSSTSLSFRNLTATRVPDDRFEVVYSVTSTPATAVLLGASTLFPSEAPVDLVVSGINEGANLGPATPISGTVGAVIAGLRIAQPQIPGIAISTDSVNEEPRSAENLALVRRIADFTARLIAALQTGSCDTARLLPEDTALNVNYPPLAASEILGVRLAVQGRAPYFRVSFQALNAGVYVPTFGSPEPQVDVAEADTQLFNQGYITIVPLDGDYTATAPTPTFERLKALVP